MVLKCSTANQSEIKYSIQKRTQVISRKLCEGFWMYAETGSFEHTGLKMLKQFLQHSFFNFLEFKLKAVAASVVEKKGGDIKYESIKIYTSCRWSFHVDKNLPINATHKSFVPRLYLSRNTSITMWNQNIFLNSFQRRQEKKIYRCFDL